MSAQHTPGPWEVAGHYIRTRFDGKSGGWLLATVDTVTDEHEANAQLIAAAPDILAELRNMVEWCGHRGETLGEDKLLPIDRQPPEVQAAMRAIAKAGEQPEEARYVEGLQR